MPEGETVPVIVFYEYFVTEQSSVPGYMPSRDGGEIINVSQIPEDDTDLEVGDYLYVITNEPLSPIDKLTDISVEKIWKNNEGDPDTDLHKNDSIVFRLKQTKYKAMVIAEGEKEPRNLYPITVNLDDENGQHGNDRYGHKTVVYVPEGASFTIDPDYLGDSSRPTYFQHTVEIIVQPETEITVSPGATTQPYFGLQDHTFYYTGATFTIDHVYSAMEKKSHFMREMMYGSHLKSLVKMSSL